MWDDEVKAKGLYCASFGVVVARFIRSMLLLSLLGNSLNVIFTFVGPVSCIITVIHCSLRTNASSTTLYTRSCLLVCLLVKPVDNGAGAVVFLRFLHIFRV